MSSTSTMTVKERWLAAIQMEPVDRLPFWPKLNGAYARAQAGPFGAMSPSDLQEWVGSDPHEWVGSGVCVEHSRCTMEVAQRGDLTTTTYKTPGGSARAVCLLDAASQSTHPVEFAVKTLEDVKVMTDFYRDQTVVVDEVSLERARQRTVEIGDSAIACSGIGTTPLMVWVEDMAGIEMAHYLLADYPDEVEALFAAMQRVLVDKAKLTVANTPADALYLVENTSTTLISPDQYRQYCYRHVEECARITRQAGVPMILHMCGHLKAMLPDLARLSVEAFEAFTSPTVGNTTLLDGRTACPDKCLVGGTNAAMLMRSTAEIIATLEQDLDALPHHRGIVVTSAGVMPPLCRPETVKALCEWVKAYPLRV